MNTATTFGHLILGESRKVFTGKIWYRMFLVGAGFAALAVFGYAVTIPEQVAVGAPLEELTATCIRFWFATLLGAGLFGVVFVSREFGSHSITRSVLLSHSRTRLFWAKTLVVTLVGLLYAVVTVILALASLPIIGLVGKNGTAWSPEATSTILGIVTVVTVAAPWGASIGWLLRSNVAAVATFLALTLIVDEGLFRLAPTVGRFTMQIAMGSVYRDDKEHALSPEWGAVTIVIWIALGLTASLITFRHRDVV